MKDITCPIEIAVNTNRLFMEGLHGLLELRLRNESREESFQASVGIESRLLPEAGRIKLEVPAGETRWRQIELYMPRPGSGRRGCAGSCRFRVEVVVGAGDDGDHRFLGEFVLTVLAHSENRSQVNINIDKVIEQHGKGGLGAINEVDLSNMVQMPATMDINALIQQERSPRFAPIQLDYAGAVDRAAQAILRRDTKPLGRCTLEFVGSGGRLLVLAGGALILGRSREDADITTWVMPLNDQNLVASREISGRHCRLLMGEGGPCVEHLSRSNPTLLDGETVSGRPPIPTDRPSELKLHRTMRLKLEPLRTAAEGAVDLAFWCPDADRETTERWHSCRESGVGGFLLIRTDGLRDSERYLWLLSSVPLPVEPRPGVPQRASLLALPGMVAAAGTGADPALTVSGDCPPPPTAIPLANDDFCLSGACRWTVKEFRQDLGE